MIEKKLEIAFMSQKKNYTPYIIYMQLYINIYQFRNKDLNKFILLLRKGVYPYEYMDSWERFNEIELPPKEPFHSELNLQGITDEDYSHAQKVYMFSLIRYHLQTYLKNLETHA